ncbi:MAG: VWA domain-containing protein [Acidobacteriota bacterium]|nr:VWA domain-containing protein [Acidobacteriota bacterium]
MLQFGFPWALLGGLSIPALVAIYFLLGRSKPQTVSALFLWENQPASPRGGKKIEKLRTPLLFFIELAVLILLTLAALAPAFYGGSSRIPLAVVLDDSYSMSAGGDKSPREQAAQDLIDAAESGRYAPIHLILAGSDARLTAESLDEADTLIQALDAWTCGAPTADLGGGLSLARDLGGDDARIWVLTDHAPLSEPAGNIKWQAYGKQRGNLAFVNASRGVDADGGWCMVELANLDTEPATLDLLVSFGQSSTRRSLTLGADEVRRLVISVPAEAPAVTVAPVEDDDLPADSRVVLVRPDIRTVDVRIELEDERIGDLVTRAVVTSERYSRATGIPDLVITDEPPPLDPPDKTWYLTIAAPPNAKPLAGPFIRNSGHPLCEGLDFGGSIWGAPRRSGDPDRLPVITAGNVPLIEDEDLGGRHNITMFFAPDSSTFQRSPAWPVLFWNLLEWRAQSKPGLGSRNLHIGASTNLKLARAGLPVTITEPDETTRIITPPGRDLLLTGDRVGLFGVNAEGIDEAFAVNTLDLAESTLTRAETGTWGDWSGLVNRRQEFKALTIPLLLAALALLGWHWWLVKRRAEGVAV